MPTELRKVHADSANNAFTCGIVIATVVVVIVACIIGAYAVPLPYLVVVPESVCPAAMHGYTGFCAFQSFDRGYYWRSMFTGLNKTNAFIQITGEFHVTDQKNNTGGFAFNTRYTSTLTAANPDGTPYLSADNGNATWSINSTDTLNVVCNALEEYCETNVLIIYPQLSYPNYLIEVTFEVDPNLNSLVDGMAFGGRTQNPKFTNYLLIYRYILLGISLLALLVYSWFYCRTPRNQLTFEHKFIFLLSISLFFFNDPIYAATTFNPTIAAAVFSTIFVMQLMGLLVVFWVTMWRRMHRETVMRSTLQADWISWGLGFIVFAFLTIAGCAASTYTRLQPTVHVYSERPVLYHVFLYITIALCVLLIIGLFFHSYKIYEKWNQVIARHKFFYQWTILFVVVLFSLLAAGMYQSYDMNGVQVMVLFLICNFYVIMLQILWRFSGMDTTGGGAYPREGSFEKAKETIGLGYFDKDTDVEFSRSNSNDKGEKEASSDDEGSPKEPTPYIAFDDDNRAENGYGVAFGNQGHPFASLDDTDNFGDEERRVGGGVRTKLGDSGFGKQI